MTTEKTEIFEEKVAEVTANVAQETTPVAPPTDNVPEALKDLVGEGKKYGSLEDAYKALPHAQKHIATLESELQELRESLTKQKTTEQLLEEIQNKFTAPRVDNTPVVSNPDVSQVSQLVESILTRKAVETKQQENAIQVRDAFNAAYGEKAEASFVELAKNIGMAVKDLDHLARTSPQAVLNLANLNKTKAPVQGGKVLGSVSHPPVEPSTQASGKVGLYPTTKDLTQAIRNIKAEFDI